MSKTDAEQSLRDNLGPTLKAAGLPMLHSSHLTKITGLRKRLAEYQRVMAEVTTRDNAGKYETPRDCESDLWSKLSRSFQLDGPCWDDYAELRLEIYRKVDCDDMSETDAVQFLRARLASTLTAAGRLPLLRSKGSAAGGRPSLAASGANHG